MRTDDLAEPFGHGFAKQVIGGLSGCLGCGAVPRAHHFAYRGQTRPLMAILQSRYFRGHKARANLDGSVIAVRRLYVCRRQRISAGRATG
jgi:hypothetical protein